MNYQEYIQNVLGTLTSLEEDYEFSTRRVLKNNDTHLDALMAKIPGQNLVPTLYFQDLYDEFDRRYGLNPELLPVQCQRILDRINPKKCPVPDYYQLDFSDFEGLKERIVLRIVSRESNSALLSDVPHRDYLDLCIIYYILLKTEDPARDEVATALIHNSNMECWGTTEDELYRLAAENTPKLLPPRLQNIESLINEIFGIRPWKDSEPSGASRSESDNSNEKNSNEEKSHEEDPNEEIKRICQKAAEECPMYVLSNPSRLYGAATVLYPGLLEYCRESLGCGFFVLPSSVHEMILVPYRFGITPDPEQIEYLKAMVREVNAESVSPMERLSDSVYLYDSEKKGLCL